MKSIIRHYNKEVLDPVINFLSRSKTFKGVSFSTDYPAPPFIVIKNNLKNYKKNILLTAGIHGNEPAGVLGLVENLNLIENLCSKNLIQCTIIPCFNISGYKQNFRNNSKNLDLNREFYKNSQSLETSFFQKNITEDFDFNIDFHETCPEDDSDVVQAGGILPQEFYLYEVCEEKNLRLGSLIIDGIKDLGFKTCQMPSVFGDTCIDGLISYPEASKNPIYAQGKSLDLFLYNKKQSKNAITIETLSHYPMEERILQIKKILTICLNSWTFYLKI